MVNDARRWIHQPPMPIADKLNVSIIGAAASVLAFRGHAVEPIK